VLNPRQVSVSVEVSHVHSAKFKRDARRSFAISPDGKRLAYVAGDKAGKSLLYVRRRLDAVVVYRYDRFARSLRQLVNALEEFRSVGIEFVSLHEGVDTSTANGRLVFGIFAPIAEFERELIRIGFARV
jgi:hypothetical protein